MLRLAVTERNKMKVEARWKALLGGMLIWGAFGVFTVALLYTSAENSEIASIDKPWLRVPTVEYHEEALFVRTGLRGQFSWANMHCEHTPKVYVCSSPKSVWIIREN